MNSYRGRFAPSPTGELHFGSLFAAVISYLDARKNCGSWFIRIEDIDPQREVVGASKKIIESLKYHGFIWDSEPVYQSDRTALYEETLSVLESQKSCYHCPCSRKQLINNSGKHTPECKIQNTQKLACATKFNVTNNQYEWLDAFQGRVTQALKDDFVLKRKEGYFAYQLAVVCDDIDQKITHVVRGTDLLHSTPMQLALYHALNKAPPQFSHFPLILNDQEQKLSKQNLASSINNNHALSNILHIFDLLGLTLNGTPKSANEALTLAIPSWDKQRLPKNNITNHLTYNT